MENGRYEDFLKSPTLDAEEQYLNSLPPGYRFRPTDGELLTFYLKSKLVNERLPPNRIKEENIYNSSPHQLSDRYDEQREGIMYFFTPRDRKYPNGSRPRRAAGNGFWKASGKAEKVNGQDDIPVGYKRTLVYYQGKPKTATKTDWLMNEFTLNSKGTSTIVRGRANDMKLDEWVLCKIYKKLQKKDREGSEEVASINSATVSKTSEPTTMPTELPITHAMCSRSSSEMPSGHSHPTCGTSSSQMPVCNSGHSCSQTQIPVYNNGYSHAVCSTGSSQMPIYNNGYSHALCSTSSSQMPIYNNGYSSSSQMPIYNNGYSHAVCSTSSSQIPIYNNGYSHARCSIPRSQKLIFNNGQSEIDFPMLQGHVVSSMMHNSNNHTQPNQGLGFVDPWLSSLEGINWSQGIDMSNDCFASSFPDWLGLPPEDLSIVRDNTKPISRLPSP